MRAADMLKTRRETVREIATALMYPLLVLFAAVAATGFIVTNLLPKLSELLISLNRPLPAMTQSLITISEFTGAWAAYIVGAIVFAVSVFFLTWLSPAGRLWIERLSLRIPVIEMVEIGAGGGATAGLLKGVFDASEPSPNYKQFVNRCLDRKGYEVYGWSTD